MTSQKCLSNRLLLRTHGYCGHPVVMCGDREDINFASIHDAGHERCYWHKGTNMYYGDFRDLKIVYD